MEKIVVAVIDGVSYLEGVNYTMSIRKASGELVEIKIEGHEYVAETVFDPETDEFVIESSYEKLDHYAAKDPSSGIKPKIPQEVFEQLSKDIAELYEPKGVKVHQIRKIEAEVEVIDFEAASSPDALVFSLTRNEVADELCLINKREHGWVHVELKSDYGWGERPRSILVSFFEREYKGEMKKVYETKSNGQRYANNRSKLMADYPEVVSKLVIPHDDIPRITARTKKDLDAKLRAYLDQISLTSTRTA